ncbi:MAG: MBL fold metallo-hydrolase [Candidatus Merdivicinus sp.]|jgi:glyoxylase-like metal-dependent hydrolase (beta-lactamase superfamily II)
MKDLKIYDVRYLKGDSAFLLDDGKTSILYDSGFGFTGFQVAKNIREILGDRELDYIFLTHSHYDHALGSAYVLQYYPNAKVAAGKYAADIFQRDGAKKVMKELDSKFAHTCGMDDYEFLGDHLKVDIPCEDGDSIEAGDLQFEVINLPGHTKCSVGFYCKDQQLLLSTETLGVYDGEKTIMPAYLVGYDLTMKSIERVLDLPIKKLLAPHYGILNEKQAEFFLQHMKSASENAAQEIVEWKKSGKTDEEIIQFWKDRYWHGYIREIYPIDAFCLNTSITVSLICKEFIK